MVAKADAQEIRLFLAELLTQDWIRRTERRVWPRYAFHYTDLRNAVRVLEDGCLYGRQYLEENRALQVSSGSDEILALTDGWVKNCVRLYFRPKTPTQYWMEGVRSKIELAKSKFPDAHCPVPVFFLFDLAKVLSIPKAQFSDRGLGAHNYQILSTASEFKQMDWQKIYHSGSFDTSRPENADITSKKNAEVIVPERLDLDSLRYIFCRSVPEQETLVHMLPPDIYWQYQNRILSSSRSELYERRHTYLDSVRLDSEAVVLHFSPDTKSEGPFRLRIDFTALDGRPLLQKTDDQFVVRNSRGNCLWQIRTPSSEYQVSIYLDDALIYANSYQESDVPF